MFYFPIYLENKVSDVKMSRRNLNSPGIFLRVIYLSSSD